VSTFENRLYVTKEKRGSESPFRPPKTQDRGRSSPLHSALLYAGGGRKRRSLHHAATPPWTAGHGHADHKSSPKQRSIGGTFNRRPWVCRSRDDSIDRTAAPTHVARRTVGRPTLQKKHCSDVWYRRLCLGLVRWALQLPAPPRNSATAQRRVEGSRLLRASRARHTLPPPPPCSRESCGSAPCHGSLFADRDAAGSCRHALGIYRSVDRYILIICPPCWCTSIYHSYGAFERFLISCLDCVSPLSPKLRCCLPADYKGHIGEPEFWCALLCLLSVVITTCIDPPFCCTKYHRT
jgi:hypothetical protein